MDSYNLAPFLPAVGLQRLFFLPVLRELGWGFPYLNSVLNSQIHSRRTCVYTVAPCRLRPAGWFQVSQRKT
jgi:hypothetical protein